MLVKCPAIDPIREELLTRCMRVDHLRDVRCLERCAFADQQYSMGFLKSRSRFRMPFFFLKEHCAVRNFSMPICQKPVGPLILYRHTKM
jgi:hypothetical protein